MTTAALEARTADGHDTDAAAQPGDTQDWQLGDESLVRRTTTSLGHAITWGCSSQIDVPHNR